MAAPVKTFICYAHEDSPTVQGVLKHLHLLEKTSLIEIWNDGHILAGQNWDNTIRQKIESAQLILLFISVDFIVSDYIEKTELKIALKRHLDGNATLIPIIVRQCDWEDYFQIGRFQALPKQARPIYSPYFPLLDDAFYEIAQGIKYVAQQILKNFETLSKEDRLDNINRISSEDTTPINIKKIEDPKEIDKIQKNILNLNSLMVFVKGGTFTMGSYDEGARSDECPHTVTVKSFYMCKFQVTQAQWVAIMGNNPSTFKDLDDCPVENVSWKSVKIFIEKLNILTGEKYCLPTEEEWEFAAKGGNESCGYKYAGSNNLESMSWYKSNSGQKTHPVGSKLPNELGLYDMGGNVWEWCESKYEAYPNCKGGDPSCYVLRGGSWYSNEGSCRVTYRFRNNPDYKDSRLGFRLVRH